MLRRGHPDGKDKREDKEESLDTGGGYPGRDPLEFPGRQVRYHLPVHWSAGGVAAKERVFIGILSIFSNFILFSR